MGLKVFNFQNPITKETIAATDIREVHAALDDLLLDTKQIENMVNKKIDWGDDEYALFEEIEEGRHGEEIQQKFKINCEASMIIAIADRHFLGGTTIGIEISA